MVNKVWLQTLRALLDLFCFFFCNTMSHLHLQIYAKPCHYQTPYPSIFSIQSSHSSISSPVIWTLSSIQIAIICTCHWDHCPPSFDLYHILTLLYSLTHPHPHSLLCTILIFPCIYSQLSSYFLFSHTHLT